jgi:hypothetical protein
MRVRSAPRFELIENFTNWKHHAIAVEQAAHQILYSFPGKSGSMPKARSRAANCSAR